MPWRLSRKLVYCTTCSPRSAILLLAACCLLFAAVLRLPLLLLLLLMLLRFLLPAAAYRILEGNINGRNSFHCESYESSQRGITERCSIARPSQAHVAAGLHHIEDHLQLRRVAGLEEGQGLEQGPAPEQQHDVDVRPST